MNETKTGVYIEIEFLDSVLVYGQVSWTFVYYNRSDILRLGMILNCLMQKKIMFLKIQR